MKKVASIICIVLGVIGVITLGVGVVGYISYNYEKKLFFPDDEC